MLVDITLAKAMASAIAEQSQLPVFDRELDLPQAYRLQHEVSRFRANAEIGGIKAGVTNRKSQEYFQIDHALIGSLYADAKLPNNCKLPYVEGRLIECEAALLVNEEGAPVSIAPAIEFVLPKFARQSEMTASGLIACNLCAESYIVGAWQPWSASFNTAWVTLVCNGARANHAALEEALNGPEEAARWMWQEAGMRGFPLGDQTLFLTGACGRAVPAEIGEYTADYGALGSLSFELW
jgi:2-keto-4-pentenoate hydratase